MARNDLYIVMLLVQVLLEQVVLTPAPYTP